MVMVIVTNARLYGIHEVTIVEGEYKHCTAALIVQPNSSRLIYNGLKLDAVIIRQNGSFIDLIVSKKIR